MMIHVDKVVAPRVVESMKEFSPSHYDEIQEEHDMLEPQ